MKIAIIGISGTGKSTLARRLSRCTGINPVFADSYVWEEDWTLADKKKAREKILDELKDRDEWIFDGYITYIGDYVLQSADRVIYLNYSGFVALAGVLKRWWQHKNTPRPEFPEGCEEAFHWSYFFNTVLLRKENKKIEKFIEKYPPKKLHTLQSRHELDKLIAKLCNKIDKKEYN